MAGPDPWGALAGGVGGLASMAGGMIANRSNQTSAMYSNQANYMMQLQQQQWQEDMSSSAYQRAAKDMKAAGLNPAMMYGGSGGAASTPSGGMAHSSPAVVRDAISGPVMRVFDALRLAADLNLNEATVLQKNQETATSAQQAALLASEKNKTDQIAAMVAPQAHAAIARDTASASQANANAATSGAMLAGAKADSELKQQQLEQFRKFGPDRLGVLSTMDKAGRSGLKGAAAGLSAAGDALSKTSAKAADWIGGLEFLDPTGFKPARMGRHISPSEWR